MWLNINYVLFIALCSTSINANVLMENTTPTPSPVRPSMLNIMAKFIEMNATIDAVAPTPSAHHIWLNSTQRPDNYSVLCQQQEEFNVTVTTIEREPYEVEVEVWCWSGVRCTELETHYREVKYEKTETRTRMIDVCCEGYSRNIDNDLCVPFCSEPCQNDGICVAPNKCGLCAFGYEGDFCEIDSLPPGLLSGANVCDIEQEYEEIMTTVENELIEVTESKWCWSVPPRCKKTKIQLMPVEKPIKITKTRTVRDCCPGFARNLLGNRCVNYELQQQELDLLQQQII